MFRLFTCNSCNPSHGIGWHKPWPLTRTFSVYFNLSVIQRVRERCRLRWLNHATAATRATITKTRRTICSSVGVLMLKTIARPAMCLCTQGLINYWTEWWRAEAAILSSLLFLSATASSSLMTFRLVASSTLYWFLAWILFSTHVLSHHSSTVNSIFSKINLLHMLNISHNVIWIARWYFIGAARLA